MRRRELIAGLGGIAAWPITARAQRPNRVSRIGILALAAADSPNPVAFCQGLRDLDYIEGQNLLIEYREYGTRRERLASLATELVKLNVDVILAAGPEATRAARQASATIPIVMTSTNPLGLGFIASLARPGGNVTGLSLMGPEVSGKRLQLLQQIVPGLGKVVLFWDPNDPGAEFSLKETQAAAETLSLKLQVLETRRADDFEAAFQAATKEEARAVILLPAPALNVDPTMKRIADLALSHGLPTMHITDSLPKAGGLVSYGVSLVAIYRRAAHHVDRILKGTHPADLPVEQPAKFALVINLKTAKSLGLTIPEALLATADEVIQ
jgi:putative tryptophan/tyrosine transport system substrate-binding protein